MDVGAFQSESVDVGAFQSESVDVGAFQSESVDVGAYCTLYVRVSVFLWPLLSIMAFSGVPLWKSRVASVVRALWFVYLF